VPDPSPALGAVVCSTSAIQPGRIGGREDRFFATVFLGSGLLLVGMLFVAAAVAGGFFATGPGFGPVERSNDA